MAQNRYSIPKVLHEFHGKQATLYDLLATYGAGMMAAVTVLFLLPTTTELWHQILLAVLALDIGGGTVANLTESTTDHHRNRPRLRLFFIGSLHLIHLIILMVIFPSYALMIALNGGYIIAAAYCVNYIKVYQQQKRAAPLLLVIAWAMNVIMLSGLSVGSLLMALFAFKLIVAYAVRWR